ncbi:MAG: hypothetical protein EBR54_03680 [Flavobacteriia bacterium]|nr:hypothetical protein [Flavobacteriia bacterium]
MLFPTAYFPSIHYLKALCHSQEPVEIEVHEHWIKQTIRNRCEILGASGIQPLTVPICHEKGKQAMNDLRVDDSKNWRKTHWKSLVTAYGRSPYFEHYALEIEACIFAETDLLVEINFGILRTFKNLWDLPTTWKASDAFLPYFQQDHRLTNWLDKAVYHEAYYQVFQQQGTPIFNPSALDLLCCEGPIGRRIILN